MGMNRLTAYRFPDCQPNSMHSLSAFRFLLLRAEDPVPCSRKLLSSPISSFPAGRGSHSEVAEPSPTRIRHVHTRSSLLPPGCAYCRSLPPQVRPSPCQPTHVPTPPSFSPFSSRFPYFPFYPYIGSPFPILVHAFISDGWVQPSQPTPTPAFSSFPSGSFAYPRDAQPLLSSSCT